MANREDAHTDGATGSREDRVAAIRARGASASGRSRRRGGYTRPESVEGATGDATETTRERAASATRAATSKPFARFGRTDESAAAEKRPLRTSRSGRAMDAAAGYVGEKAGHASRTVEPEAESHVARAPRPVRGANTAAVTVAPDANWATRLSAKIEGLLARVAYAFSRENRHELRRSFHEHMRAWRKDMRRRWAGVSHDKATSLLFMAVIAVSFALQVHFYNAHDNVAVYMDSSAAAGSAAYSAATPAADETLAEGGQAAEDANASDAAADATATAVTDSTTAPLLVSLEGDPDSAYVLDDGSTISTLTTDAVTVTNAAQYLSGVEDPWVSTGLFTTGDAVLDQLVKDFCDEISASVSSNISSSDPLASDCAYYTYLQIAWMDYLENDANADPWAYGSDWAVVYAKQLYQNNGGNCYEYAAFIAYCLRYYGYSDADPEPCIVELQSGNWGDHGLVFVSNWGTGASCIVDASQGSGGWMLADSTYNYELKTEKSS